MEKTLNYIESNKDRFLNELIEILSIPSVSNSEEFSKYTLQAADWVANQMKTIGMENVSLLDTGGYPIVYSDWMHAGADKPTVLIYGHYDVQPAEFNELWHHDPFKPEIRDGFIFGRGTADDKGQFFTHLKAVESLIKSEGGLPCNVKIIIEGEEESGNENLPTFIKENADKLKCDVVIVSDTEWFAKGLPTICYGLRGISSMELTVTGPNRDLHSGSFGGAVDNPIHALSRIIAQFWDENGKLAIPGMYDKVPELTQQERDAFKKLPYNEENYMKDLGVEALHGEKGFTTLERTWGRPALDINGIFGGYTGEGGKTIIASKATAKISIRLVGKQNSDEVFEMMKSYIAKIAPKSIKWDLKYDHGGEPVVVDINDPAIKACETAMTKAFGKEVVYMREGGSIGIVSIFDDVLKAPIVLMGLGLPTDNIHSPNENFCLDNFFGGIKASAHFLHEICEVKK